MSQIVLTHSYFLQLDPKQWKTMQPYPPLGSLYAISILREANMDVAFFDTMFKNDISELEDMLKKELPSLFIIYDDCFNYLNKMCLSNMRHAAFKMIETAKKYGCTVIISSSDATDHTISYLKQGADFIIIGEGEITLRQLSQALLSKNEIDYASIEGLVFYKNNILVHTPKRQVINDLDKIPVPAWNVINIHEYKSRWIKKHGYFSLNMVTTRGCPYKCNWCAKPIYGNRYNSHSPERITEELEYILTTFKPDHIWFCDDIFGLKPGWIKEYASLVKEKDLICAFKIQSRADLLVQEENVKLLANAGCTTAWIGTESGSQKILDAMDKGITIEQIYQASYLLKKHKIKPCFFLQFGYPGENLTDIDLTIKMINDLLPDDIGISVFHNNVKNELKLKANWVDSDDLDLMFKNTYPSGFYKQLHRYVHKTYRKKQANQYLTNIFKKKTVDEQFLYKRIAALPYYWVMSKYEKYRLYKFINEN